MPIEELKPKWETKKQASDKQAPAKVEPVVPPKDTEHQFYETNVFNAMLGRRFKCNVCNEHHEASPRAIACCFRKKYSDYYEQYKHIDIQGIKPFFISAGFSNYSFSQRLADKKIATIDYAINNRIYHPAMFALPKPTNKHWYDEQETIRFEEKYIKELSRVLAGKDFKQGLDKFILETSACLGLVARLKSAVKKIKDNDYDMSKMGFNFKDNLFNNNTDNFFNNIQDGMIFNYYHYISNNRLYVDNTQIKINGKDLYFLQPSLGVSILCRISLKYDFIPKFGIWSSIDAALTDCLGETWQSFRTIEYD